MTIEGDRRVMTANGWPDHEPGQFPRRGNPNRLAEQRHRFEIPLKPEVAVKPTPTGKAWFGVAVNGVPFEAGTNEYWGDGWNYEAIHGSINLGLDEHRAHVQPSGAYHYHGLPVGLIARLGGDGGKMLLLGWAADGFPIYTDHAHATAQDAASPLKRMQSSYRLREGARPERPSGPGGTYDGAFTADYEYKSGSGDLDECNGRTGVTPEFPGGTYYYCVTEAFPFVARSWRGTPDRTFMKGGPGMGPPGGRRGPPGRRPQPGPF
jgi:YHYH protein